jgi:cytochrome P450
VRDAFADDVGRMLVGIIAMPVNLPFTAYGRSIKASQRARRLLRGVMREKKAKQGDSPNKNLISHLLTMRDEHGQQLLTDEEIVDNSLIPMIAGYDTTSILMTLMVRHLAGDPATLAAMVQGTYYDKCHLPLSCCFVSVIFVCHFRQLCCVVILGYRA